MYDLVEKLSVFHFQVILDVKDYDPHSFYEFLTSGNFKRYVLLDYPMNYVTRIILNKPPIRLLLINGKIKVCYY